MNTRNTPTISDEQVDEFKARAILQQFGIRMQDNVLFQMNNDGYFSFQNLPNSKNTCPIPLIVVGKFQNGIPIYIHFAALCLEDVGSARPLTDEEIMERVKSGRYYVDNSDFQQDSSVIMNITSCTVLYTMDTKGYYRPYYQLSVSSNNENYLLYVSIA